MSEELKLLTAMCEALGLKIERHETVESERYRAIILETNCQLSGFDNHCLMPAPRYEYIVTKRGDL
jgi:hypothetical protein